jgi:hypothetical protein
MLPDLNERLNLPAHIFLLSKVGVGEYQRKAPFRRPGCRWKDNIKIYLKWIGGRGHNPAPEKDILCAVVDTVMNSHVQ